jgi:hypothetical protein
MNGRLKQTAIALAVVVGVGAMGVASAYSRYQGALRVRQAVQEVESTVPKAPPEAPALPAPDRVEASQETPATSKEVPEAPAASAQQARPVPQAAPENQATQKSEAAQKTEVAPVQSAAADGTEPDLPPSQVTPEETQSLERQMRNFRVRRAPDGTIAGRINIANPVTKAIRSLANVTIRFIKNGAVVAEVKSGADGLFKAAVEPGIYAITAESDSGYLAYGMQVVDPAAEIRTASLSAKNTKFQEVSDVLDVDSLAVPISDVPTVLRLAKGHIPPSPTTPAPAPTPADAPAPAVAPASQLEPLNERTPDANAPGGSDVKQNAVALEPDGGLVGRMRRIHPQTGESVRVKRMNVFLLQNNKIVAQAGVGENGMFKFKIVRPGVYSFVSAGAEGFSAFSVVTIDSKLASANTPRGVFLASFQAGSFNLFGTDVPVDNLQKVLDDLYKYAQDHHLDGAPVVLQPGQAAALAGQGIPNTAAGAAGGLPAAGGFAGGAGGAGGGGLFPALFAGLGAAGIAAAVAEANNNNSNSP